MTLTGTGVGSTLGACFLGIFFGTLLYGICATQMYIYFVRRSHKDSMQLKLSVLSLWFIDTLHLAFSTHMMYYYLVRSFEESNALTHVIWSLKGLAVLQVVIIWMIQGLYASRIWRLRGGSLSLASITIIIAVLALGMGIAFIVEILKVTDLTNLTVSPSKWAFYAGPAASAGIDILITVALIHILSQNFTGVPRTDRVLSTLRHYILSTGLLTSLAAMAYIILFAALANSLVFLALGLSITRLYVNSFLAMLNARCDLHEQLRQPVTVNLKDLEASQGVNGNICLVSESHLFGEGT